MMGLFLEEIEIGRVQQLGSYQFTQDNVARFRRQFAPVPMHLSPEVASAGLFGKPVAVGFHIGCGWMTCFVAVNTSERQRLQQAGKVLPAIGPSPGLENLRWPNPVAVGDVVDYDVEVTDKRVLKTKPGWGIITAHGTGRVQNGTTVLDFMSRILVATG